MEDEGWRTIQRLNYISELGLEYSAIRGKGEGCTSLSLIGEGRVSISSAA